MRWQPRKMKNLKCKQDPHRPPRGKGLRKHEVGGVFTRPLTGQLHKMAEERDWGEQLS